MTELCLFDNFFYSFHLYKNLLHFHLVVRVAQDLSHGATGFGLNVVLHLHALHRDQGVALLNFVSHLAEHLHNASGHGAHDLSSATTSGSDGSMLFFSLLDKRDLLGLKLRGVAFVVELSDVVVMVNVVINVLGLLVVHKEDLIRGEGVVDGFDIHSQG